MKTLQAVLTIIAIAVVFARPASAQNQPKIFQVYFQSGETTLTDEADAVISAATDYAKSVHATSVEVVGHTDTLERNPVALSFVRAREVRTSLREHGLPDSIVVTVNGVGETDPAVPIPPETSQPLDRNASITVH